MTAQAVCICCGAQFMRKPSGLRSKTVYCSVRCNYLAKRRSAEQTFSRHVNKPTDPVLCWEWTGAVNQRGYGLMTIWRDGIRVRDTAHRFSYKLHIGPIPDGMFVCHACDNPSCCNPAHLFLGTAADNVADMDAKDRRSIKLSKEGVLAIRASAASARQLGRELGVSHQQILRVRNGQSWRHIP